MFDTGDASNLPLEACGIVRRPASPCLFNGGKNMQDWAISVWRGSSRQVVARISFKGKVREEAFDRFRGGKPGRDLLGGG